MGLDSSPFASVLIPFLIPDDLLDWNAWEPSTEVLLSQQMSGRRAGDQKYRRSVHGQYNFFFLTVNWIKIGFVYLGEVELHESSSGDITGVPFISFTQTRLKVSLFTLGSDGQRGAALLSYSFFLLDLHSIDPLISLTYSQSWATFHVSYVFNFIQVCHHVTRVVQRVAGEVITPAACMSGSISCSCLIELRVVQIWNWHLELLGGWADAFVEIYPHSSIFKVDLTLNVTLNVKYIQSPRSPAGPCPGATGAHCQASLQLHVYRFSFYLLTLLSTFES